MSEAGCWVTRLTFASVAQLVEHRAFNPMVVGSSPTGGIDFLRASSSIG